MEPSFRALLDRLDRLSDQFRELRDGVQKAIRIADEDPEMALTRARKVLEHVIRDVYQRRCNEPPGSRPLENLIQRLVKDGYFPDRLDAYATTVRKLGNVGTHTFGETITAADVYQSLTQLTPILEWYFEVERPDAADAPTFQATPQPMKERSPSAPPESKVVVPKGLRSFDANDADFFLGLLPGPRDRNGLPETIRFWKHGIEEKDEPTFSVGVIYGPSGCGKSSLVKAGLLPKLSDRIASVYVEATADDTEARLLAGLRRRCPDLPGDLDLTGAIAAVRQGSGPARGRKVLVVLDQFEQWLHARRGADNPELAQALRQCDGERVQCVVLVRDDFWLALSRFMNDLHIELVQGRNTALVDLFDSPHARTVLAAFGRAFGRLPDEPTKEQEAFLDRAVDGLAQDGRVISVRLALFAEMVKGKPWAPATLKAVGGTEGVGVTFLEETFSSPVAGPRNRRHQDAARSVLKALLPERGTDIKGNMRSYEELLEASGYARRPRDFEELVRILDGEVRLITPTQPPEKDAGADPPSPAVGKYYQLTHDYLVHSLREWLTRKQRETRRGRAELRLAERSAAWNANPETRHLPAWWEWLNVRLLTRRRDWTPPKRKMMRRAARRHAEGAVLLALTLVSLTAVGLGVLGQVNNRNRGVELVKQILDADANRVPGLTKELEGYRYWADPRLRGAFAEAERVGDAHRQVNAALALLRPGAADQVDYLYGRYLDAETPEAAVIIKMLADTGHLEADQGHMMGVLNEVVDRPLDQEKTEEDKERLAKRQANAAVTLLRMGRAERVWPLLKHGPDPRARSYLIHYLSPRGADARAIVRRLDEEKETSIRRALLFCLGEFNLEQLTAADRESLIPKVLQLYCDDTDAGMHGAADWLLRQWGKADELKKIDRAWAEDRQRREEKLKQIRKGLVEEKGRGDGYWYVNGQGQTMVVIHGPVDFLMGAPPTEIDREVVLEGMAEDQHEKRIGRSFAMGAREVTVEQFLHFRRDHDYYKSYSPTADCPVNNQTWYDAAAYCNWLSRQESLPEDQWCYVPNIVGEYAEGMRAKPNYLGLIGYRLPSEAEWEYACRSGATTSRFYGETEDLLGYYAWYAKNSEARWMLPGPENRENDRKPSDLGLFDMLGNAGEWCQEHFAPYEPGLRGWTKEDVEDQEEVKGAVGRVLRGGAFISLAAHLRSARRSKRPPSGGRSDIGFRLARTIR